MAILISFACLVILLYFSLPLLLKHENTSKEQNISVVTPVVSSATPEPSDSSITSLSEETGDTKLLTMPDLTKTSLKKAQQILKNLDASIKIHVVRIYHPKKEKGQIIVPELEEAVFKDNEQAAILYQEVAEQQQIPKIPVYVSKKTERKLGKKQKLVTDSGIEILVPLELLKDDSVFEYQQNDDGKLSILIKEIGSIENK